MDRAQRPAGGQDISKHRFISHSAEKLIKFTLQNVNKSAKLNQIKILMSGDVESNFQFIFL